MVHPDDKLIYEAVAATKGKVGSSTKIKPWHLGNTTVRSPFRLREGLKVLSNSSLQGDLRGEEQEKAFRNLLGESGVVELGEDNSYSVGRKWRAALSQLGFLYPKVNEKLQNQIGSKDMITPNGRLLVKAESVPAMQECFLRALAAYYIPSVLEKDFNFPVFSPLRHTLAIMQELEKETGENRLNFIEMALIVQFTNGNDHLSTIISNILNLRSRRNSASNKRKFDQLEREAAANKYGYVETTFNDYADVTFRYLKATGLVQNKGRGLSFVPEKRVFIEQLIQDKHIPNSNLLYLQNLCKGAELPTDNMESALIVLEDLLKQLQEKNIPFQIKDIPLNTAADIALIRYQIEDILSKYKEEQYALLQQHAFEEILAYMELIITRKYKMTLPNEDEIQIPKAETPAYFEWILWRAFLAINSLTNKPYEARRFKIDQDFLPIGTAPGNGPDLIFEFDDFVIVVEVTLTTNSRQEAAEGEPVRRHVANLVTKYKEESNKPVYGLFIANQIDSNTAETFRIGVWYTRDDEKMQLNIIPLTLIQFKNFFEALFKANNIDINLIRHLLELCGVSRPNHEAPVWKQEIEKVISQQIESLM